MKQIVRTLVIFNVIVALILSFVSIINQAYFLVSVIVLIFSLGISNLIYFNELKESLKERKEYES